MKIPQNGNCWILYKLPNMPKKHTHANKHIKHFTNSKVSVIAELALHTSQRGQKGDRHGWKELQKLDQFQVGRVILGSDGTPTAGSQNDGRVSTEEWTLGNMVQTLLILVWSVKFPVSRLSISRCDVAFTYLRRSRKELNISPGMATIHVEHLNMRSCKCHHHWPNNAHRLQSLSWTSVKPWELHGFLREQFIGVPSVAIVRYFSFFISLNIVYIYIPLFLVISHSIPQTNQKNQ